jgi:hypothetical protein
MDDAALARQDLQMAGGGEVFPLTACCSSCRTE